MGCDTTYNAFRVIRTIWIALECHQTTHLLFCCAATEWSRNRCKSFSYVCSMSWESLIYHPISPRGIPQHSVHGSRGRLKAWLITFNFDRFRAALGPVIFFAENLPMGCGTTYNASRVFRTIWIAPKCRQTIHLWFCGAAIEWLRNGHKSCAYARLKSWEFLIYHLMSPNGIPRHSVNGARGRLKAWLIAFNFDQFTAPPGPVIFFAENLFVGCGTTYNASQELRTI